MRPTPYSFWCSTCSVAHAGECKPRLSVPAVGTRWIPVPAPGTDIEKYLPASKYGTITTPREVNVVIALHPNLFLVEMMSEETKEKSLMQYAAWRPTGGKSMCWVEGWNWVMEPA
jgi:hypothetical protein